MSERNSTQRWIAVVGLLLLIIANLLFRQKTEPAQLVIIDVVVLCLLLLLFFAKKFSGGVKTLVTLAFLAALSVVLSRILAINTHSIRISFGSVPILLAGLLYGPFAGALVGFAADLVGSLALSSFGYMPLLAISPVLVGGLPGLMRGLVKDKTTPVRLGIVIFITEIIAAIGWTTSCLNLLSGTPLRELLMLRVPLYLTMALVETAVIYLLVRSGAFKRLGLQVPQKNGEEKNP